MREMQGEVPGGQLCRRTKEKCTEDGGEGRRMELMDYLTCLTTWEVIFRKIL